MKKKKETKEFFIWINLKTKIKGKRVIKRYIEDTS